ncbi:MAG: rhomboid family intramembrane serine protease [Paludisphaera borealis]|uniref:rhomboid family intramembrane serine protease n=1 Tax=Paludisphaera borealis TaxID=1387353 RepID=UPI00284AABCD|nr:rhomboid family intramembrane serine protease [Paludisphaera borealis]MDR3617811.1 rhomboid family intramembrane serine protease [Paludisphaera borealis]
MIIPWGTDAPIYHRPIATVAMIVLNVLIFFAFPSPDYMDWSLELGGGRHPIQWLTNVFMHLGLGHLIGNMIFLWAFGIIVEGKLGAIGFVAVYLAMGACESALIQILVRPEVIRHMLGASGVIFGLMAICLIWAPRNDLNCIAFFQFFPTDHEIPILWFAGFYIVMEVLGATASQFAASSALAHAGGAAVGTIAGVGLLKAKLVDCEGWDLLSIMAGRKGQGGGKSHSLADNVRKRAKKSAKKKKADAEAAATGEDPSQTALRTLRGHLEAGETEAALSFYRGMRRKFTRWRPPDPEWIELIKAVLAQKAWDDASGLMRAYIDESEFPSDKIRLRLAEVLIRRLDRPVAGERVLEGVAEAGLTPQLAEVRRQLAALAEQKREEGVLEIDDEVRGA